MLRGLRLTLRVGSCYNCAHISVWRKRDRAARMGQAAQVLKEANEEVYGSDTEYVSASRPR